MNKQNYSDLQAQLDEVMAKIQAEDLDVEEAIRLYKKGQELIAKIETYLGEAEVSIKKVTADFNKKG